MTPTQIAGWSDADVLQVLCGAYCLHERASWPNGTSSEDTTSEQSKPARTKAQQHCSRDRPTHAPHPTRHQHQWKLTATRVDLAQMLSKSCAIRTISAQAGFSVHPGQATNGMFFLLRWRFDALSAIRIRPPSCYECPSIPKMFAGRVRVGTHDMHDVQCV